MPKGHIRSVFLLLFLLHLISGLSIDTPAAVESSGEHLGALPTSKDAAGSAGSKKKVAYDNPESIKEDQEEDDPADFICSFKGNLAIKDECVKYKQCKKLGDSPTDAECTPGKHFDHFQRTCVDMAEAKCGNSKDICPTEGFKFEWPNPAQNKEGQLYLVCKYLVPFPSKCPGSTKYDSEKEVCVGRQGLMLPNV